MAASLNDGLYTLRGVTVPPQAETLFSIQNDNQRFRYVVTVPVRFHNRNLRLRVDGQEVSSSSYGGDTVSFDVDAQTAQAIARDRGIPARARAPLDEGLEGTFSAGDWQPGGPLPVSLTLAHQGEPVDLVVGGRQRGPRNNRFSFSASRDGVALPVIEAYDFGGISTAQALTPGEPISLEVDAAGWLALTEPGTYAVRCRYEGELWVPGRYIDPWPDGRHLTWDLVIEQTIVVEIP